MNERPSPGEDQGVILSRDDHGGAADDNGLGGRDGAEKNEQGNEQNRTHIASMQSVFGRNAGR
jgi:hypothetical protein